jgi:hypothetical protein
MLSDQCAEYETDVATLHSVHVCIATYTTGVHGVLFISYVVCTATDNCPSM